MSKSFLNHAQIVEAKEKIDLFTAKKVHGRLQIYDVTKYSEWLSNQLMNCLTSYDDWELAGPIATGSLARMELCSGSDIDLIFTGEENRVFDLVQKMEQDGLKIRYRIPKDLADWTVGVEAFDTLALLDARALVPNVVSLVAAQHEKILKKGKKHSRAMFEALICERKLRHERFEGMSNYLEPHIKLGPGGLRDLLQIKQLRSMFNELFPKKKQSPFMWLERYAIFFLGLRQKIHIAGSAQRDTIVAEDQILLAQWLDYPSVKNFMREVNKGLSMANFYGDWVIESISVRISDKPPIIHQEFSAFSQVFEVLKINPSSAILQERAKRWIKENRDLVTDLELGVLLKKFLVLPMAGSFCDALFRSGLLEFCIPTLAKVRGLVQHDQYHRFTVLGHTRMVLREIIQIYTDSSILGSLKFIWDEFTAEDWEICLWTALYHDLGKGQKGDHSLSGSKLVTQDFARLGLSEGLSHEVNWMVKHHLAVSRAAFRRNPDAPETWQMLFDQGFDGRRLLRMTLFTVLDIRGTNKEAWNQWKEGLLKHLVDQMLGRETNAIDAVLSLGLARRIEIDRTFLDGLGPEVLTWIDPEVLLADYLNLAKAKSDLEPLVVEADGGDKWIRFHRKKDDKGLFLRLTQLIYALGGGVQLASINSFKKYGVYDWFRVRINKSTTQIYKRLKVLSEKDIVSEDLKVNFNSIHLVEKKSSECTISFRGVDQRGALIAASKVLYREGLAVKWARVHTWGRQIEDVFCVRRKVGLSGQMKRIKASLLVDSPVLKKRKSKKS